MDNFAVEVILDGQLLEALLNAENIVFMEDRVPYFTVQDHKVPLGMEPAARENINHFIALTAPEDVIISTSKLSIKDREDYIYLGKNDTINYSITSSRYAFRCCYKSSMSGVSLIMRRTQMTQPSNPSPPPIQSVRSPFQRFSDRFLTPSSRKNTSNGSSR